MMNELIKRVDGRWLYQSNQPFLLQSGEELPAIELVYETWGTLNKNKDNVIVVHHALSVGSHVAESFDRPERGWWNDIVGPGKPVDSNHFFVVCINNLGSCFGSSGPTSVNPHTGRAYNASFPSITIGDMVNAQRQLIETLGIRRLYAIIGNSMGAMLSLAWAIAYPSMVNRLMLTCTSYKAYPANIANRDIQQSLIRLDPAWNNGNYDASESLVGFQLARKLGLYTYRNAAEWNNRFNSFNVKGGASAPADHEIVSYMDYNAKKFVKSFDANSYLTLLAAMDSYDVTRGYESTRQAFSRITASVVLVSEESDILFTPQQQQELFSCLQEAQVTAHFISQSSQYGHDSFLIETEQFGFYIKNVLSDRYFSTHKAKAATV